MDIEIGNAKFRGIVATTKLPSFAARKTSEAQGRSKNFSDPFDRLA